MLLCLFSVLKTTKSIPVTHMWETYSMWVRRCIHLTLAVLLNCQDSSDRHLWWPGGLGVDAASLLLAWTVSGWRLQSARRRCDLWARGAQCASNLKCSRRKSRYLHAISYPRLTLRKIAIFWRVRSQILIRGFKDWIIN